MPTYCLLFLSSTMTRLSRALFNASSGLATSMLIGRGFDVFINLSLYYFFILVNFNFALSSLGSNTVIGLRPIPYSQRKLLYFVLEILRISNPSRCLWQLRGIAIPSAFVFSPYSASCTRIFTPGLLHKIYKWRGSSSMYGYFSR